MVYAGSGQQTARGRAPGRRVQRARACRAPTATPSWHAAAPPSRSTTASWATSRSVDSTRCSGALLEAGVTPGLLRHHARRAGHAAQLQRRQRGFGHGPRRGAGSAPAELVFCFEKSGVLRDPRRRDDPHPRDHRRIVRRAQSRRRRQQRHDPQGRERRSRPSPTACGASRSNTRTTCSNDTGTVIR